MKLTQRQQWMLLAGTTSAVVAPLAERAISGMWRRATGDDPPADSSRDVDWGRVVTWTVISAVTVGLAQVAARRGAALVWESMTGETPPRPRRRRKRRLR